MSAERNPAFSHLGEFGDPPTALALKGHLGRLLQHGDHLLTQAEKTGRGLTPKEEARFTEITTEAEALKREIALVEAEDAARARDILAKLDSPTITAGPGPTMKAFSNDRKGREAAYDTGMFLHGVLLGDVRAQDILRQRMPDVDRTIRAAHSSGVNSAGGVLVPEQFSATVIRLVEQYGVARQLARVINCSTDTINIPRRTGGLTATFTSENASITESDTTWDNVTLSPKKLAILTRMSTELRDDALISVVDMLATECAYSFASKEDACLLIGTGVASYGGMTGAFVKAIDGSHALATVAAASGHDTFGELDLDDLISLMALIPTYARPGSVWLCSPEAKAAVFDSLRAAAGGITAADISGGFADSFLGHRIILSPHLPGGLTTDYSSAAMLGFGNLGLAATIASRTEIRVQTTDQRYFEYDQIGLRATERFDCVVHDLGSASVKSPFGVLTGAP